MKQETKELYEFLRGRNKPFFVDTFRDILNRFDKEEISMSKFVEILNIIAYNWKLHQWQPVSKDADYDGTYLGYIEKTEECKAINHYQRTVFNVMNKWVLEKGERLLHWMELPKVPNSEQGVQECDASKAKSKGEPMAQNHPSQEWKERFEELEQENKELRDEVIALKQSIVNLLNYT